MRNLIRRKQQSFITTCFRALHYYQWQVFERRDRKNLQLHSLQNFQSLPLCMLEQICRTRL